MNGLGSGDFAAWTTGQGQVDMVVAAGAVPGLRAVAVAGGEPLARVTVWEPCPGGWRPTEDKAAIPVSELEPIPPLAAAGEIERARDARSRLVTMVAAHQQMMEHLNRPPWAMPSGHAIKTVFARGCESWPGAHLTGVTAEEWALGRVEAFLALASGVETKGYRRDVDLLPFNHPALGAARGERETLDPEGS